MKKTMENEVNLMKHLINYGNNQEEGQSLTKPILEYHETAKNGKTYGIVRECNRYYIKVAPKKDASIEILPEEYDYLGGFNRRNDYSYRDYAEASKQFGLKMQSIAEAVRGNETYTAQPQKEPQQADWQVNETKEMRAEINRYKQIVSNANGILTEGTAFTADHTLPEAPAKNPSKEKVNYPFTDTAVAKGDKGFVPDDSSKGKKCNGAPFCDEISKGGKISDNKQPTGEKGDVYNEKPIYAPTGSATSMKSKMKPVRFGEGKKKVFKLSQEQLNEYVKARRTSINESGEYTDGAPEATHNSDTLGMKKAGGTRIGTDGDAYNEKVHMNEEGEYTDGAPEATHNSDTENYGDGTSDVGTGTPYEKEVGDAETSSLDHSDDVSEDGSFDLDDVAGMPDDNPPYPEVKDDDEDDGDDYSGDDDGIEIDIEDDGDPAYYEHPEESYRRRGNRMNEWEGHDFGNHPGYQKIPLTTPNGKAPLTYGHEWADGTEGNGDEPFGLRVGSGSPFDKVIDKLADAVIAHRLSGSKKKVD